MKREKKESVETNTSSHTMDDAYHSLAQPRRNPQAKEHMYNAQTNDYLGNKSLSVSDEALECKVNFCKYLPLHCIS